MLKNLNFRNNSDVVAQQLQFAEFDDNNLETDERVATDTSIQNRNFPISYNSTSNCRAGGGEGGGVQSLNISAVKISKIDLTRIQKRKDSHSSVVQSSLIDKSNFRSNPVVKQNNSHKLSAYNLHVHPFLKSMNFQLADSPYYPLSTKNKQALPLQTPKNNTRVVETSSMKKIGFKQNQRSPIGANQRQGFGPILKYKKINKGFSTQMLNGKFKAQNDSNKLIRTPKALSSSQRTMSKSWLIKGLKNRVSFSEEEKSPKAGQFNTLDKNLSQEQFKKTLKHGFKLVNQNLQESRDSNGAVIKLGGGGLSVGGVFNKIQTSPRINPKNKNDILPSFPCDEDQKQHHQFVDNKQADRTKMHKIRGQIVKRILNQRTRLRINECKVQCFYIWKNLYNIFRQIDSHQKNKTLISFFKTIDHNLSKQQYFALNKWKKSIINTKHQLMIKRSQQLLRASNNITNICMQNTKKSQTFKKWRDYIQITRNISILTKKLESIQDLAKAFEDEQLNE